MSERFEKKMGSIEEGFSRQTMTFAGYSDEVSKIISMFISENRSDKNIKELEERLMKMLIDNKSRNLKLMKKRRVYRKRKRASSPLYYNESEGKVSASETTPFINNMYLVSAMNILMNKQESKTDLSNPWKIADGIAATASAAFPGYMPFEWASNIKIVDKLGENVCLVHPNKRELSTIISAAPEMFAMLCYVSYNQEQLFGDNIKTSPHFVEFIQKLNLLISNLITGYNFSYTNTDTDSLFSAISTKALPSILRSIMRKYTRAKESGEIDLFLQDFDNFISGNYSTILEDIFEYFESAIKECLTDISFGEASDRMLSFSFSESIIGKIKNSEVEINSENVRGVLQEILTNNKFRLAAEKKDAKEKRNISKDISCVPLYSVGFLNNVEAFSQIWNPNNNYEFDKQIEIQANIESEKEDGLKNKKHEHKMKSRIFSQIKNIEDFDILLRILGIEREIISEFPEFLKRIIVANVFEDDDDQRSDSSIEKDKSRRLSVGIQILKTLWENYNLYMGANPNFIFDIEYYEKIIGEAFMVSNGRIEKEKEIFNQSKMEDSSNPDSGVYGEDE